MEIDKKIRIVLLIDVLEDIERGAERQVYELVKRINKDEFELHLFVLHHKEIPDELKGTGCRVEGIGIKRIYDIQGILEGLRFAIFLNKQKADILMTYHFASDIWGTFFAKLAKVRWIISNRRDEGFWRKKRHILAYKLINRCVNKIIVNSKAVHKMVLRDENVALDKVKLIYNGVDLERFREDIDIASIKKDLGLSADSKIIGCIGNLREIKGHRFLIKAGSEVIKKYPDTHFLIIGEGELKMDLKTLSEFLGIEKNMHFLGKRKDVPNLLKTIDICVLPSLSEGLSNALLEYMAAGRPIIATKVGGNPELIKDKINGLLVEKSDSKDLAEKIIHLLENEKKTKCLGSKAKEFVEEYFSLKTMVKRYEDEFQYLIKAINEKSLKKKIKLYIKIIISYFIYHSGIFALLRFLNKKSPLVLCYHRIVEDFDKEKIFSHPGLLVSKESFIRQIHFLKKYYKLISMDEFINYLDRNTKIPNYSLLITFDDGYRDNYTIAYPILKQSNIPATIFIATDFIDTYKFPQWDKERPDKERLMLSWEEINEMSKDSIHFGTHTQSHLVCNEGVADLVNKEVLTSKRIIEKRTGKDVQAFAFPNGVFNIEVLSSLKKNGIKCSFSLDGRGYIDVPKKWKNFVIKRISINEGMYINNNGRFSFSMFACGVLNLFKIAR